MMQQLILTCFLVLECCLYPTSLCYNNYYHQNSYFFTWFCRFNPFAAISPVYVMLCKRTEVVEEVILQLLLIIVSKVPAGGAQSQP